MKKLFTLILFFACAFNAIGQIIPNQIFPGQGYDSLTMDSLNRCLGCLIKIEGTDALGNKDTIVFGAARNATLGVDNSLGERNYLGIQFNPLDMRFIQRDTICWGRIFTGTPRTGGRSQNFIYFPNPLDLKTDVRASLWVDIPQGGDRVLGSITKHTLKISASNYPISLKLIQLNGFNYPINYSGIELIPITNCIAPPVTVEPLRLSNLGSIITLTSQVDWYAIGAGFDVNSSKLKKSKLELGVYPIPAAKKIQITGLRSATNVSITSIAGKEIKNLLVNPESPEVNIEGLEKGIYLLQCQSKEGVQALRIVKQ